MVRLVCGVGDGTCAYLTLAMQYPWVATLENK